MIKTPRFWKKKSIIAWLLYPISLLYRLITKIRSDFAKPYKSKIPVICIGNVTAGGAGKTPAAIAIARICQDIGKKPVFLSRGYGGRINTPTLVTAGHTAKDTGDEPLLLSRHADTLIAKDRADGAKFIEDKGYDVIIMDDGFQNPYLAKTLSLLVIDGHYGIGNGFVLPAGPLREPLSRALHRCHGVVMIGDNKHSIKHNKPLLNAHIKICDNNLDTESDYLAFAGIANPLKFFKTLSSNGFRVKDAIPFPDHYSYSKQDINRLTSMAEKNNCKLITTEKDLVRIDKNHDIKTLAIELVFEDENKLKDIIKTILE